MICRKNRDLKNLEGKEKYLPLKLEKEHCPKMEESGSPTRAQQEYCAWWLREPSRCRLFMEKKRDLGADLGELVTGRGTDLGIFIAER